MDGGQQLRRCLSFLDSVATEGGGAAAGGGGRSDQVKFEINSLKFNSWSMCQLYHFVDKYKC